MFIVGMVFIVVGFGILYYKNFSWLIVRRLLKEVNVVTILLLAMYFVFIQKPQDPTVCTTLCTIHTYYGLVYLALTIGFVFLDAVKKKNRYFVLVMLILDVIGTYLFFHFAGYGHSSSYFSSSIHILFQAYNGPVMVIHVFSINAWWRILFDKKMEELIFVTGNIYRESGTTSKYVEDRGLVNANVS